MSGRRLKSVLAGLAILGAAVSCTEVERHTQIQADAGRNDSGLGNSTGSFSVMTWNLEWFYDEYQGDNFSDLAKEKSAPSRQDWNWRRNAVAEAIAKAAPSVVGLQEIENQRVLWYLTGAIRRGHQLDYREFAIQGGDHSTEQDVGFLVREDLDVLSISRKMQTRQMFDSNQYMNLTKHMFCTLDVPVADGFETVTVLNLHLRAKPENETLRRRQGRLAHHWVAEAVRRGENVIVLGDFNTDHEHDQTRPGTDLGTIAGLESESVQDDLIDLTLRLSRRERETHFLGKHFDRILVSPALLADDPARADLVFASIEVRKDLAIRRGVDRAEQHWDAYWRMKPSERDLSDHFPVVARFDVR